MWLILASDKMSSCRCVYTCERKRRSLFIYMIYNVNILLCTICAVKPLVCFKKNDHSTNPHFSRLNIADISKRHLLRLGTVSILILHIWGCHKNADYSDLKHSANVVNNDHCLRCISQSDIKICWCIRSFYTIWQATIATEICIIYKLFCRW